jgi:hypothetical protein
MNSLADFIWRAIEPWEVAGAKKIAILLTTEKDMPACEMLGNVVICRMPTDASIVSPSDEARLIVFDKASLALRAVAKSFGASTGALDRLASVRSGCLKAHRVSFTPTVYNRSKSKMAAGLLEYGREHVKILAVIEPGCIEVPLWTSDQFRTFWSQFANRLGTIRWKDDNVICLLPKKQTGKDQAIEVKL